MSFFSQIFNAFIPQIVRVTVDSILGTEEPQLPALIARALPLEALRADPAAALLWAAGAVVCFAVLRGLAIFGQRLFLAKGSEGFVKGIRDELYSHIQRLPFAWHTAHQTGEMIQRCTSDVEVVRTFVCTQLVDVIRTVITIAVYLWAMFAMNTKLALVSLAFVPVVALSSGLFYGRIASRFKTADEAEGELTTMVQENLTGVRVVRAFGRESFELGKFNVKNDRFSELWIKLGHVLAVYWASGTLLTCLQVMVILILGMMLGSGISSVVEILQYLSSEAALKSFVIWTMGSLGDVTGGNLALMLPVVAAGLVLSVAAIKPLNLLLLGENYARTMGLNVQHTRTLLFLSTVLLAGTVTAFCGPVGFIGLAVPHLARMLFASADHRIL
ncbi:MAG: iron chelate uptake ABC transporter family permease subunit, partial [Firmicutes bacterium]|nr:iron chelate uptake ABC transporter family permease subunit [Bacillota bacterium]